jgi:hypothetical protein
MSETTYPKLKYQGVEIKPGQHHTENPGYIYVKVNDPDQEDALEGDWHDSPRAAIDSFKANAAAALGQRKTEQQELQARERGIPPAGPEGGGAPDMPDGDTGDIENAVEKKDEDTDHEGRPRENRDWPTEKTGKSTAAPAAAKKSAAAPAATKKRS